jgi:hypothetical protein
VTVPGGRFDRWAAARGRLPGTRAPALAFAALTALVVATFGPAGCAADHIALRATATPTAPFTIVHPPVPTAHPVICDGAAALDPLRALFADVTAGRSPALGTYFTVPDDFVSWWDPTLGLGDGITVQAAPGQTRATLDGLRDHLVTLESRHAQVALVDFAPGDYEAGNTPNAGGGFTFTIHARPDASTPAADGSGQGTVDCYTGRIKTLAIDDW